MTLHDYLGDSLSMRLPIVHCSFRSARHPAVASTRTVETNVLGEDSSSNQTGEQLLQQFLDPPMRDGVIHIRSERSSERSSPASSDFGGVVEDDADMAIKETVNDPTGGIRLTILKRPKVRPGDDVSAAKLSKLDDGVAQVGSSPSVAAAPSTDVASREVAAAPQGGKEADTFGAEMPALKMSKAPSQPGSKVKVNLNDVFEEMVARRRGANRRDSSASGVVFVFKFQGRVQECVAPTGPRLLPRWGIGGRTTLSWYQVLCRRSRFIGRRSRSKAACSKPTVETDGRVYRDRVAKNKDQSCVLTCALDLAWTLL